MPQIAKGGKFVFGWSLVSDKFTLRFPKQAIDEYCICSEGKIIIIQGSKRSGGFSVSKKELLEQSVFNGLLLENAEFAAYKTEEGKLATYKGRQYTWLSITDTGIVRLSDDLCSNFSIKRGSNLLSIRSSNIAFTMALKGPLIESALDYDGEVLEYFA